MLQEKKRKIKQTSIEPLNQVKKYSERDLYKPNSYQNIDENFSSKLRSLLSLEFEWLCGEISSCKRVD